LQTILRNTVEGHTVTTTAEDRVAVHMAAYNFLIYFMPRGERWRPFVTGGIQAYDYQSPNIANWPPGKTKQYGGNWGGGLKLALFPHALVRLDFRDYIGGKPYDLTFEDPNQSGGIVHQLEGTVGFGITF
jgi:hypothetical protein